MLRHAPLLLLLAFKGTQACNYEDAATAMFGASCAALMGSDQAGFCTAGHPQSAFIGYVCGTSCGLADTYKSTYPNAYGVHDNDGVFQQVMGSAGGGNRADTAPGPDSAYYAYYEDIVDADPNTPGKQISKFSCSQLQEAGTFWGTGLPGFCTPVVSAICPESYDAICVPAGYAAKAVSTECDLQCEGWCNQYTVRPSQVRIAHAHENALENVLAAAHLAPNDVGAPHGSPRSATCPGVPTAAASTRRSAA